MHSFYVAFVSLGSRLRLLLMMHSLLKQLHSQCLHDLLLFTQGLRRLAFDLRQRLSIQPNELRSLLIKAILHLANGLCIFLNSLCMAILQVLKMLG